MTRKVTSITELKRAYVACDDIDTSSLSGSSKGEEKVNLCLMNELQSSNNVRNSDFQVDFKL